MRYFAVSATLKKSLANGGGMNIVTKIELFKANNPDEAIGMFVMAASEQYPEHDIHVRPVIMELASNGGKLEEVEI